MIFQNNNYSYNNNTTPSQTNVPISKQIFSLRKQNNHTQAYELVRSVISQLNIGQKITDIWLIRACCYTITDILNEKFKEDPINYEYCSQLCSELDYFDTDLCNETTDQPLQKKLSYCKNKCQNFNKPGADLLKKINNIPKKERNAEAIELIKQYINETGDTSQVTNLGWRIYYYLTELLNQNKKDINTIKKELKTYIHYQINTITDNHILNKLILNEALKLNKFTNENRSYNIFDLPIFIRLWDPQNIVDELWKKEADKKYPSIAESVYMSVAKRLTESNYQHDDVINYFIPYIKNAITRLPENIWLNLYLAKIFCKLKKSQDAYDFAYNVLKNKRTESWAWHIMANVSDLSGNEELQLSCLAKALLCHDQEQMKVSIHKELAEILLRRNLFNDARYEYDCYFNLKQKLSPEDQQISCQTWYVSAPLLNDHTEFYKNHTKLAEELLLQSVPSFYAILGPEVKFKDRNTDKIKTKRIINLLDDGNKDRNGNIKYGSQYSVSCNEANFSLYKVGTMLKIKGEVLDHKLSVMSVSEITEDKPIKVITHIGLVSGIDYKTNNAYISFVGDYSVKISTSELKSFGINPQIGSVIKATLSMRTNKDLKKIFNLMTFEETGSIEELPSTFASDYSGYIKRYNEHYSDDDDIFNDNEHISYWPHGFVKDELSVKDIFIPPILAKQFKHMETISGIAIKSAKGYQAISAIRIAKE